MKGRGNGAQQAMSKKDGEVAEAKENESKPSVELFTDGACSGNPGPGGWAFILRHSATGKEIERFGGEAITTNNRMELTAVIEGLRTLKKPSRVEVYADSQYVLKGLNEWMEGWKKRGWKRGKRGKEPVMNVELWQELDRLRAEHELVLHWVRGHTGHSENERCDELAVEAIARYR